MKSELVVKGDSPNIFAELGLPNADEHFLKGQLVAMISQDIRQQRLNQKAAAALIGVAQPDISRLLRGHFEGFSLERLLNFLVALGHSVRIDVEPANENDARARLYLAKARTVVG